MTFSFLFIFLRVALVGLQCVIVAFSDQFILVKTLLVEVRGSKHAKVWSGSTRRITATYWFLFKDISFQCYQICKCDIRKQGR